MNEDIDFLRFPIGKFSAPNSISKEQLYNWINQLEKFPAEVQKVASLLSDNQLNTHYRPGGWTIRQVIHHLPDSHLNAYIRFKLAVTEENPIIRPYHEDRWAACKEAKSADISISLSLLESLHFRWAAFLRTLTDEEFDRSYIHPETNKMFKLKEVLGMYVWHGNHHLAHITETIKRNKW
jgi:hypothetical protein